MITNENLTCTDIGILQELGLYAGFVDKFEWPLNHRVRPRTVRLFLRATFPQPLNELEETRPLDSL